MVLFGRGQNHVPFGCFYANPRSPPVLVAGLSRVVSANRCKRSYQRLSQMHLIRIL